MVEKEVREAGDDGAFLTINGVPIYFSEDWNAGIGGGLWSTGLAMATYFRQHADEVVRNLNRLSRVKRLRQSERTGDEDRSADLVAMELGSGNGFLSVCLLALIRHKSVSLRELVVTDTADHLELIASTLKANSHVWDELILAGTRTGDREPEDAEEDGPRAERHFVDKRETTDGTTVVVAEHLWGKFPSEERSIASSDAEHGGIDRKYDFIFGTDLAYRNSLHEPLIATLARFSHRHTLCLIGVTMVDTQPVFFDRLTRAGFRYEKLADHLLGREFGGRDFGIIAVQRR